MILHVLLFRMPFWGGVSEEGNFGGDTAWLSQYSGEAARGQASAVRRLWRLRSDPLHCALRCRPLAGERSPGEGRGAAPPSRLRGSSCDIGRQDNLNRLLQM